MLDLVFVTVIVLTLRDLVRFYVRIARDFNKYIVLVRLTRRI